MIFCLFSFCVGLFMQPKDLVRAYYHVVKVFKESTAYDGSDFESDEGEETDDSREKKK